MSDNALVWCVAVCGRCQKVEEEEETTSRRLR